MKVPTVRTLIKETIGEAIPLHKRPNTTKSMDLSATWILRTSSSISVALIAEGKSLKNLMATDVKTAIRFIAHANLLTSWMSKYKISQEIYSFLSIETMEIRSWTACQPQSSETWKKRSNLKTWNSSLQSNACTRYPYLSMSLTFLVSFNCVESNDWHLQIKWGIRWRIEA